MLKTYNQRNHRYINLTLGTSKVSFQRNGCTTCAICVGHSKIFPENPISAEEAARSFSYTDSRWKGFKAGLILWKLTDFDGLEFLFRKKGKPSHDEMTFYGNNPSSFMILELDRGLHWVYLHKNTVSWLPWVLVVDSYPNDPDRKNGIYKIIAKKRITGFACFTVKP